MMSAVVLPANCPPGAAWTSVSAPKWSCRNWLLRRYQYAAWIMFRGGRDQSRVLPIGLYPVSGRTSFQGNVVSGQRDLGAQCFDALPVSYTHLRAHETDS